MKPKSFRVPKGTASVSPPLTVCAAERRAVEGEARGRAARLQDYRAALATAVSSGADFGLCTVLRIRMSGGNRFLPP